MGTRKDSAGFTLIEIMVVVVILSLLAVVAVTQISGRSDKAKWDLTKSIVLKVASRVSEFQLNEGVYPKSLHDLLQKPDYAKHWPPGGYFSYEEEIQDAWGHELHYNPRSNFYPEAIFDVFSYGADDKEGGEGVNEDIWNHDKWKKR